jgi:hypothetical protein
LFTTDYREFASMDSDLDCITLDDNESVAVSGSDQGGGIDLTSLGLGAAAGAAGIYAWKSRSSIPTPPPTPSNVPVIETFKRQGQSGFVKEMAGKMDAAKFIKR